MSDIENVVDDLEGETEIVSEVGEGFELSRSGVGGHAAEAEGGGEKRGGFVFVNANQLRLAEIFTFAFEIENLSSDEFFGSATDREFAEKLFEGISFCRRGFGQDNEGLGEQGVTGENGHAFAIDLVRGWSATAQVVVVHRGKVVVHEGVSVHDFHCTGRAEGVFGFTATGFGGGEGENGTESLAAGEHGVAHGLMNGPGAFGATREKGVQRIIDEGLLAFKIGFEVGHGLVLGGELTKAKL